MADQEMERDLDTKCVRKDIQLSLTDEQYEGLLQIAYEHGFENAGQLLASFTADLTDRTGSDEAYITEMWLEKAHGGSQYDHYYFRYYLFSYCYIDDEELLMEMYVNDEVWREVYNDYKKEAEFYSEADSEETCRKVLQELLEQEILRNTELSVIQIVEEVISLLEKRKPVFTNDERKLFINHVQKWDDITWTLEIIHELAEKLERAAGAITAGK